MKRVYLIQFLISLIVLLTACTAPSINQEPVLPPESETEIDPPFVGEPIEVYASIKELAIGDDAINYLWEEGDAINVFHAKSGTVDYVNDDKFIIEVDGIAESRFTGKTGGVIAEDEKCDWFALYPFSPNMTTPDNNMVYAMSIGNKIQSQNGNDNHTAVRGSRAPLFGRSIGSDPAVKPSLVMEHLTALVKVNVKNLTSSKISVSSLKFETSKEDVSGSYFVNIAEESPLYIPKSDSDVFKEVTLFVNNGEAFAEEASFFFTIKPFVASAEETITITLTMGNGKKNVTTIKPVSDMVFSAGVVNNVDVDYNEPGEPTFLVAAKSLLPAEDGKYYYMLMSSALRGQTATNLVAEQSGVETITDYENCVTDFGDVDTKFVWRIVKNDDDNNFVIKTYDGLKCIEMVADNGNFAKLTTNQSKAENVSIQYDSETNIYTLNSTSVATRTLSLQSKFSVFAFFPSGAPTPVTRKFVLIPYKKQGK